MTTDLQNIKQRIGEGDVTGAIDLLTDFIRNDVHGNDEAYYLLGNAYRKTGDWQQALNNYLEAIERNPDSPAAAARDMLMDILNFYNKDMYNQ